MRPKLPKLKRYGLRPPFLSRPSAGVIILTNHYVTTVHPETPLLINAVSVEAASLSSIARQILLNSLHLPHCPAHLNKRAPPPPPPPPRQWRRPVPNEMSSRICHFASRDSAHGNHSAAIYEDTITTTLRRAARLREGGGG